MSCFIRFVIFTCFFFIPGEARPQASYEKNSAEIKRLSTALSFRTFVPESGTTTHKAYVDFIHWLTESYPLVKENLSRTVINDYSIIYKWKGRNSGLPPVLLIAHYDVASLSLDNEKLWSYPPFGGHVDHEYVWGRGALDNKSQVLGMLEAIEGLLKTGFRPQCDLYLAFGHDEETGGEGGAAKMGAYFQQNNVRFSFILDEGGAVLENMVPGIEAKLAFIGTAEKGYANVELVIDGPGGHPSVPVDENTINLLAAAIIRLEKHPMPARLQMPTTEMLRTLGPHMQFPSKLAVKHSQLFRKNIIKQLEKNPATAALVRSIFIPTMISAGNKENVLPGLATVNINIRLLQFDDSTTVLDHINRTINDKRIRATIKPPYKAPSAISSSSNTNWKLMEAVINKNFPEVGSAPYLFPGSTDSYHYAHLTNDIFRFTPLIISSANAKTIHGTDERISVTDFHKVIEFYAELIRHL